MSTIIKQMRFPKAKGDQWYWCAPLLKARELILHTPSIRNAYRNEKKQHTEGIRKTYRECFEDLFNAPHIFSYLSSCVSLIFFCLPSSFPFVYCFLSHVLVCLLFFQRSALRFVNFLFVFCAFISFFWFSMLSLYEALL